jgi:hypothetical protein
MIVRRIDEASRGLASTYTETAAPRNRALNAPDSHLAPNRKKRRVKRLKLPQGGRATK